MLLSFRVSNYCSIRDEQEFSFVRDSRARPAEVDGWDEGVGTVAGIFGANASGKSNFVRALRFMRTAVVSSYESWANRDSIPVIPFALESSFKLEPSLFEVVLQFGKVRYQYGFRLTKERVASEWLYVYPTHRRQVWFERDADSEDEWYFGKSFTGRNRVIADLTRPTTLFLSAAVANNHKMASQVEHFIRAHLHAAFPDNVIRRTEYTQNLSSNEERWKSVVDLLRFADLGISTARVRHDIWNAEQRQAFAKVFRVVNEDVPEEEITSLIERASDTAEFGHSVGVDREPTYLALDAESLGTQTLFALAGPVIRAISNGDTLVVDEIDASLHPNLTCEIIRIFKDPEENPKQAQLIFTSHDTTLMGGLLNEAGLARDEVWFTEKKIDGATTLYPLTDFSPRKTENLERGYLQGRYGAVPYLHRNFLSDAVKRANAQAGPAEGNHESESSLDVSDVEDLDVFDAR
jgi:energy-coupling factor transporter ATP-binding protein EcfA2